MSRTFAPERASPDTSRTPFAGAESRQIEHRIIDEQGNEKTA